MELAIGLRRVVMATDQNDQTQQLRKLPFKLIGNCLQAVTLYKSYVRSI